MALALHKPWGCEVPMLLSAGVSSASLTVSPLLPPGQLKLSIELRGRILALHGECHPRVHGEVAPEPRGTSDGSSTTMPCLQALSDLGESWCLLGTAPQHSSSLF